MVFGSRRERAELIAPIAKVMLVSLGEFSFQLLGEVFMGGSPMSIEVGFVDLSIFESEFFGASLNRTAG